MQKIVLAIGIGGFIGAISRYGMSIALGSIIPSPFSIWFVNMIGCFLLLFFIHWKKSFPKWIRIGIATGIIGAFTTFSTFIVDFILYWNQGEWLLGSIYFLITIIGAGIASYVGYLLAQKVNSKQQVAQHKL
ncbi:CrcB family protein [Bacillaceae bacterium S4-13-58]